MIIGSTVRYGTVRYGTVRYGTVRYGTVRYGTVRYGTVRYGIYSTCICTCIPVVHKKKKRYYDFVFLIYMMKTGGAAVRPAGGDGEGGSQGPTGRDQAEGHQGAAARLGQAEHPEERCPAGDGGAGRAADSQGEPGSRCRWGAPERKKHSAEARGGEAFYFPA